MVGVVDGTGLALGASGPGVGASGPGVGGGGVAYAATPHSTMVGTATTSLPATTNGVIATTLPTSNAPRAEMVLHPSAGSGSEADTFIASNQATESSDSGSSSPQPMLSSADATEHRSGVCKPELSGPRALPNGTILSAAEYVVDKIINHRQQSDGKYEFLVRWCGYTQANDSWEPMSCVCDCQYYVEYAKKSGIMV